MKKQDFVMKVGESLVAGGPPGTAAEPEVVIGKLDGPFGTAFANLIGNQIKGHTKVLAIMNTDVMVRPPTLMVSKVTVKDDRYTNILMGTVQGAIANGVLDSVREGYIPKDIVNEVGIIVSVWLKPEISSVVFHFLGFIFLFSFLDSKFKILLDIRLFNCRSTLSLSDSPLKGSTKPQFCSFLSRII